MKKTRIHGTCEHCKRPRPLHAKRFCSIACRDAVFTISPADRFWPRVDKSGSCWLWTGALNGRGYGQFWVPGRSPMKTHQFAWVDRFGPIPQGKNVLHRCDVRNCVNPDHLFLGTLADNARDCSNKGRARGPAILTADNIREIRGMQIDGFTQKQIGAKFGVGQSNIQAILSGRTWKHVV